MLPPPRPRFIHADGSRNDAAIDQARERRMRHYELFQRHVPGICSAEDWRLNVLTSLEADINAEERNRQRHHLTRSSSNA